MPPQPLGWKMSGGGEDTWADDRRDRRPGRIRLGLDHAAAVRDRGGGGDVEGFQELVGLGESRGQVTEFRVEAARVAWQKNVGRQR